MVFHGLVQANAFDGIKLLDLGWVVNRNSLDGFHSFHYIYIYMLPCPVLPPPHPPPLVWVQNLHFGYIFMEPAETHGIYNVLTSLASETVVLTAFCNTTLYTTTTTLILLLLYYYYYSYTTTTTTTTSTTPQPHNHRGRDHPPTGGGGGNILDTT